MSADAIIRAMATDCADNALYRTVWEQAPDIILIVAPDGSIIEANNAAVAAYGYTRDELRGICLHNLLAQAAEQISVGYSCDGLYRTVHVDKNGMSFPVEVSSRLVRYLDSEVIVCIVRIIADRVELAAYHEQQEAKDQLLHKELSTAYEELSAAYEELTASEEELREQFNELLAKEVEIFRQNTILQSLHDTALGLMHRRNPAELLTEIITCATKLVGTPHGFIYQLDEAKGVFRRTHGLGIYVSDIGREIPMSQGVVGTVQQTGKPLIVNDYAAWRERFPASAQFAEIQCVLQIPLKSEGRVIGAIGLAYCEPGQEFGSFEVEILSRFAELASIAIDNAMLLESMSRMAYNDALTGLPNRLYLQKCLDQELAKARRGEANGAILLVGMDDLKMVNDTLGHSFGDSIIKMAGSYLQAAVGENTLVARIGGDEFIVLLFNGSDRQQVGNVASKIVDLLNRDYDIGDTTVHLSVSIGIAGYPSDGLSTEDIMKNADLALCAAKAGGKNTWRYYETSLQESAYEKMLLKRDLRKAIERGELTLYYQPLVTLHTGRIGAFESLLRWISPTHGLVPPSRFIPLAEENDMIIEIGEWVIREACRFARKLTEMGKDGIRISVNVSPRQLAADNFVAIVNDAIATAGISAGQLEIEITENALIDSLSDVTSKLQALRDSGVGLSLDDFGTGYSSLTYLKNLPVSTLKLDKSFIDSILSDAKQQRFIRSIVNMAHALKLAVVAEGVETEKQMTELAACHCDYIQGYLFSRPVPEEMAIALLARSPWLAGTLPK